jgi:hypothetical protein
MGPSGIKPIHPDHSERKGKKESPDSKGFRDLLKIDKTREVELEERKKKSLQSEEESKDTTAPETPSSSSTSSPYEDYYQSKKSSIDADSKVFDSGIDYKKEDIDQAKFSKEVSEKKLEKEKQEQILKQETEKKKALEAKTAKTMVPEKKPLEQPKTKSVLSEEKRQEFEKKSTEEKKGTFIKKSEKERKKEDLTSKEIPPSLADLPKSIATQAQNLTSSLTPYLHTDVVPLFEKMIGTIIHIQSQGISETQVMLNSAAFASSVFFGSKITLTKFSTAPDSFNIVLTGSNQAVNLFNENIDDLMSAFQKGNFDFKVRRLEAVYDTEKPLVKRKKDMTQEDQGF